MVRHVRYCDSVFQICWDAVAGSNQQYLQYAELTAGMELKAGNSNEFCIIEFSRSEFLFEVLQDVAMWGAKTVQRGNDTLR